MRFYHNDGRLVMCSLEHVVQSDKFGRVGLESDGSTQVGWYKRQWWDRRQRRRSVMLMVTDFWE